MFDIALKLFAVFLAGILMFITPQMITAVKTDQVVQVYAQNTVEEFVNNAAKSGKITEYAYREMISKLDNTGVVYEIHIAHSSKKIVPEMDDDGTILVEGDFSSEYEDYIDGEIYEILFPDYGQGEEYYLNDGDYLRVYANSITPTLGTKYRNMLIPMSEENDIMVNYGTYVSHEQTNYN